MTFALSRRAAALMLVAAAALATPAHADQKAAEAYVQEHAPRALAALNDANLTAQSRQTRFAALFEQFADMEEIALFVLGAHAAKLKDDPALKSRWVGAFRDYAMAVYQDQLDQYRSSAIKVTPGGFSRAYNGVAHYFVNTQVSDGARNGVRLQWRLTQDSAKGYKVIDVQLRDQSGNAIWLGQQQKRFFEAFLGGKNGDIAALIADVDRQTKTMRARIAARENGRAKG
jgi:phospholipid transport system substrate-binding protein